MRAVSAGPTAQLLARLADRLAPLDEAARRREIESALAAQGKQASPAIVRGALALVNTEIERRKAMS